MGGKIIGGDELQVVPASVGGEHLPNGEEQHGYAELMKGLLSSQPGMNKSSSLSPFSAERIDDEPAKVNGVSITESTTRYDEKTLHEGLKGLSVKSGEGRDSAPEGIAVDNGQRSGGQTLENGRPDSELQDEHDMAGRDSLTQQQTQASENGFHQAGRGYESQRAHEYRQPPCLVLPDQTSVESEFGGHQQVGKNEYTVPHALCLPSSLVMSPHDGKPALLDPNAREFTPSPSPCPSPVLPPGLMHMAVPTPFPLDPAHLAYAPGIEMGQVVFGAEYSGGPMMPLFGNGGPLAYASVAASPSPPPWDGLGMPELLNHGTQGSGPIGLGQPLPPHVMRSYGLSQPGMQSFIPYGRSPMSMPGPFVTHPPMMGREHVSRALLLNGVPTDIGDGQLRQEMEQWGPVRAMGMERCHEGLVTVHYYDLRHAKEALRDIQQQHLMHQQRMQQRYQLLHKQRGGGSQVQSEMYERQDSKKNGEGSPEDFRDTASSSSRGLVCGRVMWAQYTVPVGAAAGPDSLNQGTLVVFNLDVEMPLDKLRAAFEVYGAVKELRETPAKKQHKFVEFYDVRDAAHALKALDGQEIGGKRVKIEFSRPGGQAHKARVQAQHAQAQARQQGGPLAPLVGSRTSAPGAVPGPVTGQPMYVGWNGEPGVSSTQPMVGPPGGPPYMWTNFGPLTGGPLSPLALVQPQQWNSGAGQLQPLGFSPMHGGPPSPGGLVVLAGVEAHGLTLGRGGGRAVGGGFSGGPGPSGGGNFHGHPGFGRGSSNAGAHGRDGPSGRKRRGASANGNVVFGKLETVQPGIGNKLGMRDSPRSGKSGLTPKCLSRETVPSQYVFDEGEMQTNEMSRTTLMIKNIPNKYSQGMLLQLLDRHCLHCNSQMEDPSEPESAYDFVYLPIDFKNRCNLGYAFVNFTSVEATKRLYKAFHAQQWEAFNSRKICQVTYARVQGRVALEEHFRNSRFACDTDEYLPLCFSPPRTGIILSSPMVAAGHLAGRTLGSSPREELGPARTARNGELRERAGDDLLQQALVNGNICGQEQETDLLGVTGGSGRGFAGGVNGGRRTNTQQNLR